MHFQGSKKKKENLKTILGKISKYLFTFFNNFLSPQVKQSYIIITRKLVQY